MTIERDKYLNGLLEWKDKDIVKIVTGPRRSGKTFLLFNLFASELLKLGVLSQNIIQINLELEENKKLRKSLNLLNFIKEQIINENKYYVLIDEIQNVKNFEDSVNYLLNIKNVDLYITGSNSKFLSRDIETQISSRATEIKVRPLTFKEFYSVKKELNIDEVFKEYLTFGGMPFLVNLNYESKKKYLKELFETTYINDIVERNKIKSDEYLQEFVDFLTSNVGSLTNNLNICNTYKTLKQNNIAYFTIDKYLKNLSHTYLIDLVQLFNLKGKRIIKRLNKIYFYDLGIRNSRIGYNNIKIEHAIENIVYNELVIRNYDVNIG
ncbi:ATP-binding protein [Mycoplasmopsis fermentans]|nr:ATP-binding protein [Mycoplasmopsis fermentans]ADN68996.1 putative ATPase [Mycoplasmopsis fermentans JER]ADV34504.1 AAA+ superfamily ATPase [Mycoplasmopsis fermentans M64]VEU64060.1 putative ATPase, AAA+ superfamily [Mycoplasmopsis fermentans]VEU66699.1 putative ATPase, AAA+ superfamily [Mesomycoplasma conjunctivae]